MRSAGNCASRVPWSTRSRARATITSQAVPGAAAWPQSRAEQSAPIASRQQLVERLRKTAEQFGTPDPLAAPDDDQEPGLRLPRPENWGGYRLWAAVVELWCEGEHRLHDRARWTRVIAPAGDGRFQAEPWHHERLQP